MAALCWWASIFTDSPTPRAGRAGSRDGKAVWQVTGKLGKGSLAYADGLLYLRAEAGKGTVAIIEASPDGYKELSRFDPPDRSDKNSWAHPVVTDGRLYLRDQDLLQCSRCAGEMRLSSVA